MLLSLIRHWLQPKSHTAAKAARRSPRRSRGFRPQLEHLEDRRVLSTTASIGLYGGYVLDSYAGVGFQENEVATMQVIVNGQPDVNKGDFQAQIQWGDGGSSTGDLVYQGTNGSWADYLIKGSHVYQNTGSNIPVTVSVTGPGGSSASFYSNDTDFADVTSMPSGIPGTQPSANSSSRPPANVAIGVNGGDVIDSYAGVGFQENQVANIQVMVNGQPDPTLSDFHAQINWGDSSSWDTGDLVYQGTNGSWADYIVKGSHVYQYTASNIPVVVYITGPDGTSAIFAPNGSDFANVVPMPSGLPGTQPSPTANSMPPANVAIGVYGGDVINSSVGVGFQENEVASIQVMVNGQPDNSPGDVQAQINWGDSSSWDTGDLVDEGSNGSWEDYIVQGSHVYQHTGSNIPIVVYITGPDGTSATFAPNGSDFANVSPNANAISLGSLSPTQWQVNQPGYDGTISVRGGKGGYQNLQVTGLPAGLSATVLGSTVNGQQSGTITISGTPTQSGTFNLGVSLQDGNGDKASGTYTLTVSAAQMTLGSLSPTQWQVSQPGYDGTISVKGGSSGYQNLQVSGLPSGLSATVLSSAVNGQQSGTITISGTPTQSGTFNLGVSLQDSSGNSVSGSYSLTVTATQMTLGSLSPTQWQLNQPGYDGTISVKGGSGGYQNLQVSGLPSGLSATVLSSAVNGQQSGTITISGTPTQSGTFNLGVSLQDSSGNTVGGSYSLTVSATPLTLGSLSPTQWQLNQPGYDGTIAVGGGSGSYSNLQVSGLPAGLSAALSGSSIDITGTPTQSGTFSNILVSVGDSTGDTGSNTYSLTIVSPQLSVGSLSPSQWTVNEPGYDGTIPVSGGTGTYSRVSVTGLPSGLSASLSGSTITVSGTPRQTGTFSNIAVSVWDSSGTKGSGTETLTISPALSLGTLSPTVWDMNEPGYDGTIAVQGGSGSYSNLSVTGLPAGLSADLSGSTVEVTGTPTQAGTFRNIVVSLQDGNGATASRTESLTIDPALTVGMLSPTQWTVNQPGYHGTITVSGGTGSYSNLSVTGLPPGMTAKLSGKTITVSGTPTQTGTFNNVTVSLQDGNGNTASAPETLTINPGVTLGTLSPTEWDAKEPGYDGTISVSGGTGAYKNLHITHLPPGLIASVLSSTIGGQLSGTIILSGTPTQSGTFNMGVTVQDSTGATDPTFQLTIHAAVTLGNLSLATATVNQQYNATIPVTGGKPNYSNATVIGSPVIAGMGGLTATVDGGTINLTGTPSQSGTFTVTVQVQDSLGAIGSRTYTLKVAPAASLAVSPDTLPAANMGQAYSARLLCTGGSGDYNFTYTPAAGASLPVGLTFSSGGLIYGTPAFPGSYTFTVSVTDEVNKGLSLSPAKQYVLTVNSPLPVAGSVQVSASGPQRVGVAFPVTITATNSLGSPYTGTVTLTSSDGETVAPDPVQLTNGTGTANVTVNLAGTVTLSAATATATGSSGAIVVVGAPASLMVSAPFTATVNRTFYVTVAALDPAGNVASVNSTVTLTCSNGALLSTPATVTLTNGTAQVPVTLKTAGQITIQATATTPAGTISGTSSAINVGSTSAADLALNAIVFGQSHRAQPEAAPNLVTKYINSGKDPNLNPYTCGNFVDYALTQSGGRDDIGPTGTSTSTDYNWGNLTLQYNAGDPLSGLDQVQPGDVIQLRDVNAQGTLIPQGAPVNPKVPSTASSVGNPLGNVSFNQHSALIEQNLGGGKFVVLEQASNGHGYVTEDVIDLSTMSSGTMWVYQPLPK